MAAAAATAGSPSISAASPYGAATAAVGGSGEAGGGAGTVLVTTIASTGPQGGNSISTSGDKSFGIFAQSIGGGGGNGGFSVDVSAAPQGASLAVAVGGSGGGGGAGGQVTIMSDAAVTTQGYRSSGLYAHSIGGGGGDATFAAAGTVNLQDSGNLSVSVAGDGGAAGSADKVVLQNSGTVQTTGDQAFGLDAQSIGGGGGNGGTSVSGTLLGEYDVGVAVGGQGSGGGNGAEVDLTNNAAITTLGDKAIGISAQSIGGSGGRGGLAIAGNIVFSNSKTLNLTLGGSGGAGGSAGAVSVTNTGAVTTGNPTPPPDPQDNAHAIFAQSVGGGGGHGGMAGSFTFGTNQSGGSAQVNVGIAVGGSGAAGNVGGSVDVTNSGALVTNAGQSHGIFAQSIGGGGGAGGAGYSASFDGLSAASSATYDIEFAIGGGGGTGNHAGPVTVGNQGSIETFAADSHGIYAHSVGGGGGSGGSAYTLAWNLLYATPSKTPPPKGKENYELQVRVGGSGGSGGDGDTVTITNAASIHTRGPDSHGILGYSVGGGGGDGGSASGIYVFPIPLTDRTPILQNVSISVGGSGASNGTGGEVDVTHTAGDITTEGQGSAGIYAQSVGGGGGKGGNGAAGATGTVGIGGTGRSRRRRRRRDGQVFRRQHHDAGRPDALDRPEQRSRQLVRHLCAERRWRRRPCRQCHLLRDPDLDQRRCPGRGDDWHRPRN